MTTIETIPYYTELLRSTGQNNPISADWLCPISTTMDFTLKQVLDISSGRHNIRHRHDHSRHLLRNSSISGSNCSSSPFLQVFMTSLYWSSSSWEALRISCILSMSTRTSDSLLIGIFTIPNFSLSRSKVVRSYSSFSFRSHLGLN